MPENTTDATVSPIPGTPPAPPDPAPLPGIDGTPDDDGDTDDDTNGQHLARDLAKERRQRRAADKTIGELRKEIQGLQGKVAKFEDANKTEAQRQADEVTAAKADAKAAREAEAQLRLDLERRDVAEEKGLPAYLGPLLQGNTREELEAHADKLKQERENEGTGSPKPRKPQPDPRLGRAGDGQISTADQFAAALKPRL